MKFKQIIIYILLLFFIIFSFFLPKIVIDLMQDKILDNSFSVSKENLILNENIEKSGIINTIYDIYNNNQKYSVSISDTMNSITNGTIGDEKDIILNNIKVLSNIGLVKNQFIQKFESAEEIVYRTWYYDNGNITYENTKIFTNLDNYKNAIGSIKIENISGKVISLKLNKQYIDISKEQLEKYAQYLELDNYNDWNYSNGAITSNKCQIKIETIQDDEYIEIKVVPLNYQI